MSSSEAQKVIPRETTSSLWTPDTEPNSIQFRLDSNPDKKNLQAKLLGLVEQVVTHPETKKPVRAWVQVGSPKVNVVGCEAVMLFIESHINKSNVMGNITDEQYMDIVAEFHGALYKDLWVNQYIYGIPDNYFNSVVDACTGFFRIFITRPIANKEREGLSQSQKMSESVILGKKNTGLFGLGLGRT